MYSIILPINLAVWFVSAENRISMPMPGIQPESLVKFLMFISFRCFMLNV